MNIHVESLPECKVSLRVEIPADQVRQERHRITNEFAMHGRLPGFRPGKAPRKIIERKFQRDIQAELEKRLLNEGYRDAIKEQNLEVLMIDKIDPPEFHSDDTMTFSATLVTVPHFDLPDYKGIPVQAPRIEVGDEDIEAEIEKMRGDLADYEEVTDRAAEAGDFAEVSYTGHLGDQVLAEVHPDAPPGLKAAEEQWMVIDEKTFLPGFTGQLVGHRPGDELEVTVTVPDDFPVESLRGEAIRYSVTLVNVRRQVLPEVTDELVEERYGEQFGLKTVSELRDSIREQMANHHSRRRAELIERQVLAWLDNQLQFDLPTHLLYSETQRRVDDIANRALQSGIDEQKISEQGEAIINNAAHQARINVKAGFVLERIADAENIKAESEEISRYLMEMAMRQGRRPQQVLKEAQKSQSIPRIADNIRLQKAMGFLVEQATVTEVDPPTPEELAAEEKGRAAARAAAALEGGAGAGGEPDTGSEPVADQPVEEDGRA